MELRFLTRSLDLGQTTTTAAKMQLPLFLGVVSAVCVQAASSGSWGFSDATVSVHGKGSGVGGGVKEKYVLNSLGNIR